jgi:hypothetical protein
MQVLRSSYAASRVAWHREVGLPADGYGFTWVSVSRFTGRWRTSQAFLFVNPVPHETAAGKLTNRWSSHRLLRSLTLTPLLTLTPRIILRARMRARTATFVILTSLLATLPLASPAWAGETFGVESFESKIVSNAEGAGGGIPDLQAGSHPYELTTAVTFNHVVTEIEEEEPPRVRTYGDPKDIEVNLPRGVIVNPRATVTRCTEAELESPEGPASCPNGAAVGVFSVYLDGAKVIDEPVYNMAPPAGVPAELGFDVGGIGLIMHAGAKLRTGGDYGLSADISYIPQEHPIYGLELTLWGDPSAAAHDVERGLCADEKAKQSFKRTGVRESCPVDRTTKPFLTLPSSCTGEALTTTMSVDSWQEPGKPVEPLAAQSPAITGCENLAFSPKLTVSTAEPEAASTESPSGLNVDLKLPQEESVSGLAEASLKDTTVTLPVGMAISPAAATGRASCTPEEIGLSDASAPSCPDASKLGVAKILTPLLEAPLEGSIYLAQQGANPFGSLLALYLVAEGDGMSIKLVGKVEADPVTGQLTITFEDNPQLPFSELKLSLFGGPRALLVTPPACGTYVAQSELTPWSGTPAVTVSSSLDIGSGPNEGACPSGRFDLSFTAGTASNQAGAFSPFSLTFSRQDGEQRFGAFTVRLPPGLLGILKGIALCPEPQASQGGCPQASRIGTTTVGVGPGPDPLYLPQPGQAPNPIYLTGPTLPHLPEGSNPLNHPGSPFGLSIVIAAKSGPFDLGTVVMRAAISIDPHTAQLIVTSDQLPQILQGLPLDIRTVNMMIDRAGFIFNPTNCNPLTVAGTVSSTSGVGSGVSSPFEAANCASLPFNPKVTALTHSRPSRAGGIYLHVKVVSGPGQANIGKLKLDLPKQLPSRNSTLQKACPAAVFDANPANCPAGSVVGTATAVTPVLKSALTGPAYLVSHGGQAFPDLEIVLRGEGITLDLDGQTQIRRGITSSSFKSVPDVPIDTFDLVLFGGPHSLLSAKGNICSKTLQMPTALVGQNGAVIHKNTKIGITGCRPARPRRKRVRG